MNEELSLRAMEMTYEIEQSWQSRCLNDLLELLPIKKQLASAAAVQERVRKLATRPASHVPKGLGKGVSVTLTEMDGWPVYRTTPTKEYDSGNVRYSCMVAGISTRSCAPTGGSWEI